ncbi:type 1 glutamine amidotransferase [Raineyella fluvialis]|uniref:Lipid II isoglutaminyl synthase (glutamine-hydrolyzing) subunit GatD n=1 Tax=Raineyella fluvialis TaxID=2662261 RepID=A0A5Q2F6V0_9ACTN|nr:glutamine amidotransferase [Raineyella fluvialis]QGF22398.1 glutamine amidotransferase [Raineyella fluvialis]
MTRPVHIVLVYQSLLGIYGDRGNATVLMKRLQWRGFEPRLTVAEPGQPLPDDADIYLLGGGEDGAQTTAVRLLSQEGTLHRAAERGAVVFAVCAGYQILGTTFTIGEREEVMPGLGLLDITTRRGDVRAVGEILTRLRPLPGDVTPLSGDDALVTGFENHGGMTTLGPDASPLADVEIGIGNGDGSATEGAIQGSVVGTYPHGPILARNPGLADFLLETALRTRLDPLPVVPIPGLRRERVAAIRQGARG